MASEFFTILQAYGLEGCADIFARHRIDLDILAQLTDADLKEMAIPIGDRKRLTLLVRDLDTGALRGEAATGRGPEMRLITALFADLVGSTELAHQLDEEDNLTTITRFHDGCSTAIGNMGGQVARFVGDAVLGCFGYPLAADDDPERAAIAALDLVASVGRLSAPGGSALRARVGIATGVALTGALQGSRSESFGPASGTALHLAARLQERAAPGQVLLDADTRAALGRRFVTREQGRYHLHGFSAPSEVHALETVRDAPALRFAIGSSGPGDLIGRDEELQRLRQRWVQAAQRGSAVLISGEAGIGKTRLVQEFLTRQDIPEDCIIYLDCQADDVLRPLHPVIRAFRHFLGFGSDEADTTRHARLRRLVEDRLRLSPRATATLSELLGIGTGEALAERPISARERKRRVFDLMIQMLERLSLDRPLLVCLEDLHWLDPTTEELLTTLVEGLASLRILLIGTLRPDRKPEFEGRPRVSTIPLGRLDAQQAARLSRQVAEGRRDLPPDLTEQIVSRTDGIPLFVEELTRAALESEIQLPGSGSSALPDYLLPLSLRSSLLARLDRVSGAYKVAPVGAAFGLSFSRRLVREVTGLPDDDLDDILGSLVSAHLLIRDGAADSAMFQFHHALMRETAYSLLTRSQRRQAHARIAQVLEHHEDWLGVSEPHRIAGHHSEAGHYLKARDWWMRAAEAAADVHANREAVGYIRQALDANAKLEESADRLDREIQLRERLRIPLAKSSIGSELSEANFQRILKLRRLRGSEGDLLSVRHGLAARHVIVGRVAAAREQAAALLEGPGGAAGPAAVLGLRVRAFVEFLDGDFDAGISHFRSMCRLCDSVNAEVLAEYYHADSALIGRGMIAWALALKGDEKGYRAELGPLLQAASRADPWSRAYAQSLAAAGLPLFGAYSQCRKLADATIAFSEAQDFGYWRSWCLVLRGWARVMEGQVAGGMADLTEGIEGYDASGSKMLQPFVQTLHAQCLVKAGRRDEARRVLIDLDRREDLAELHYADAMIERLRTRLCNALEG